MRRSCLLLLPVLLGACTAPLGGSPPAERSAGAEACRAEATRVVQWRERGQTMRTDETENSRGTTTVTPFTRTENDRLMAQMDRDRIAGDCLRVNPQAGAPR